MNRLQEAFKQGFEKEAQKQLPDHQDYVGKNQIDWTPAGVMALRHLGYGPSEVDPTNVSQDKWEKRLDKVDNVLDKWQQNSDNIPTELAKNYINYYNNTMSDVEDAEEISVDDVKNNLASQPFS